MSTRPPAEKHLTNVMRMAASELERERRAEERHRRRAQEAERVLTARWNRECQRFGMDVPADPFILDVLASIVVENPGERWLWTGLRNNKGTATVRTPRGAGLTERTVVRVLAEAFGVVTPEQNGVLYPVGGDSLDVNPFHRKLRSGTNKICAPPWARKESA